MIGKKAAAWVLAAFALCSVGLVVYKDVRVIRHRLEAGAGRRIVVFYFHGKVHCASCDRIEALGREAVENGFEPEIRAGLVQWRPVDVDNPANEHYVYEYALLTRSIVVTDSGTGRRPRWKNLDRVWELLDRKNAFERYVQDEVGAYVGSP